MGTASLYQGLTFLAWTSVGFLVVVGIFLIKVLFDLSRLFQSINQTANLVKDATEPIMSDLTETIGIINSMVKKTETNVMRFKNISSKISKVLITLVAKTSTASGFLLKGLWSIIKTFIKK